MTRPNVALLVFLLLPAFARGQSVQLCYGDEMTGRVIKALDSRNPETIINTLRLYLAKCSDIITKKELASNLSLIGANLIEQGKYEDSIPVLRRCVIIDTDNAMCWYKLGKASINLGRRFDAKAFWNKTIEIGGFDTVSALYIESAKKDLADLEYHEKILGYYPFPDPSAPEGSADKSGSNSMSHSFGTGFFVSNQGHIITNNHVVAGCETLVTRDGKPLRVINRNASSDLALLKADFVPRSVAMFRSGPSPKLGDTVVAFGFPLPDILSSEGNISTGVLSATSGLQNDIRFVQISAPVQPGNSGGPLFDSSGHVIGVVVAKLDALQVARVTGDVPQNVNFAVHWAEVQAFLGEEGVQYRKEPSTHIERTRDIAAAATQIAVAIDCAK
jgi:S1-C subfamily serine protease